MLETVSCLIKFVLPEGDKWFGNKMDRLSALRTKHFPLRKVYRNFERTEIYIIGQADENVTSVSV